MNKFFIMSDTKAITFNRLPILGQSKVEFEDWKFSYERWCTSNKIADDQKLEYLISITEGVARTIVINSLNKENPDDYATTMNKLKEHYKSPLPKNSRLLELSTLTIKKGENVSDFNTKFDTLVNKTNIKLADEVLISYYINSFRSFTRTYEALLEEEPTKLEDAKRIASKKEKIYNLVEINKSKNKTYQNNSKRNFNEGSSRKENNNKYIIGNYNNVNKNNNTRNPNYVTPNKNNNINQGIEYRRNVLKPSKNDIDDLQEITKKLADLKINVCLNCQRIGHVEENCPEWNEYEPLN